MFNAVTANAICMLPFFYFFYDRYDMRSYDFESEREKK